MIRLDPTRRQDAINIGFEACNGELEQYRDAYFKMMDEWTPVSVCDDDRVIGALIAKDNVIHIAIIPEYRGRWASRRIIREMLKYGTMTDVTGSDDNSFIERIGFRRAGGAMYQYEGRY